MSTSGLSPPGSSSYHSGTMSVGDGTWDSSRNDFLLPNLQGLNFATMRYNGMGNRFKDDGNYHTLILGHGVLAAITFLLIVPVAVFLAKYGRGWPGARVSFKLHVYCQILVVFLSTVILVLGWFAVGPERSLTNPHHGIGVAIYVLIMFQFLYGYFMYRRERRRSTFPTKLPLSVWLHKLLGRSIALLAIVQIALGLTLYGSPKALFVLYALAGAFWIFWYLALDYYYKPRVGGDAASGPAPSEFYSEGSFSGMTDLASARPPPRRQDEHHWGRDLLAAGGVLGAYEAWKFRRDRRREDRESRLSGGAQYARPLRPATPGPAGQHGPPGPYGPPGLHHTGRPPLGPPPIGAAAGVVGAHGPPAGRPQSQSRLSAESWENEKYDDRPPPQQHTWRNRFLEAAGGVAAYEGVRSFFNRRRRRDDDVLAEEQYGSGRYRPQMGGHQNMVSQSDVSRVHAGQAPESPGTPRINIGGVEPLTPSMTPSRPPRRPMSQGDAASYDSRMDYEGAAAARPPHDDHDDDGPHTLRDSIAAFGAIAGLREWNRRRREKREYQRTDDMRQQELDNEDVFNRRHENTYPRPQDASAVNQGDDSTLMTGPTPTGTAPTSGGPLRPGGGGGGGGAPDTSHPPLPANAGAVPGSGGRTNLTPGQGYTIPPPPAGPLPGSRQDGTSQRPEFHSAYMPSGAVQPDPNRLVNFNDDPRLTSAATAANTAANEGSAYGRNHGPNPRLGVDAAAAAAGGLAGAALMSGARRPESELQSPSRFSSRQDSRARANRPGQQQLPPGSMAQSSASNLNTRPPPAPSTGAAGLGAPAGSAAAFSNNNDDATASPSSNDPRLSLKVHPHHDGNHVTVRRLNEQQAAAERAAARRQERRNSRQGSGQSQGQGQGQIPSQRQRRRSSLSSGNDEPGPSLSQRYRRNGNGNGDASATTGNGGGAAAGQGQRPPIRPSSNQPITNVPQPPPMSSSALGSTANRPSQQQSQQSLPFSSPSPGSPPHQQQQQYQPYPAGAQQQQYPQQQQMPRPYPSSQQLLSSPSPASMQQQQQGATNMPGSSGLGGPARPVTSPSGGAYGTDTEGSTFADNRRRRRAERARRLEASRGTVGGVASPSSTGQGGGPGAGAGAGGGESRVEFQ